jgi:hypothetical protein
MAKVLNHTLAPCKSLMFGWLNEYIQDQHSSWLVVCLFAFYCTPSLIVSHETCVLAPARARLQRNGIHLCFWELGSARHLASRRPGFSSHASNQSFNCCMPPGAGQVRPAAGYQSSPVTRILGRPGRGTGSRDAGRHSTKIWYEGGIPLRYENQIFGTWTEAYGSMTPVRSMESCM